MDKAEFIKDLGSLFNTDCNHNEYVSQFTFTHAERERFLTHLWQRFGESGQIDFGSLPAVTAMLRARKVSDSIQVQLGKFPIYFQEEVEKARVKK